MGNDVMTPVPAQRVVAIVQARMGSTRFPGKVLRPIAGKALLWHVVHRLKRCRSLDAIAVATTTAPRDDAIAHFCREEGIEIVRGPEDNVLARYVLAADRMNADIVVRVTSDAPFVDPPFIDGLVRALIEQDGDYVLAEPGIPCAHEGVDPFSRRALDKLAREAANDPVAREHVSGYFKLHPDFARIVHAPCDPGLAKEPARLTVDTPDDLAFIEALHQRMEAKAGEASLSDLLLLLEREPRLKTINAHVRQKPLQCRGGLALIHCDGGGTFGYGHLKRSLTLARALRDREGFGVLYALNGDGLAAGMLRSAGFETTVLAGLGKANAVNALVATKAPGMLIVDGGETLMRAHLARLRDKVAVTAVIDDGSDRRLAAAYAYYPPVPQVNMLSWKGAHTERRVGWEWALLGFDPSRAAGGAGPRDPACPTVVVSMGGSDPLDLTRLAACALSKITASFKARFVIGPGFRNIQRLKREIEAMNPNFTTVQGVSDLGQEFAAADLALVTFGVTAYELAALGVPALYIALTDDHALSASSFADAGMGIVLGLGRVLRIEEIARSVWQLIVDGERRRDMRAASLNTVDGKAGERIAADLVAALEEARGAMAATAG
jgi:spore coat polysaccharide biosynthesis protein SpsF